MDIGIPEADMVRLGFKTTARTASLLLREQNSTHKNRKVDWTMIDRLKHEALSLRARLHFNQYISGKVSSKGLLEFLEFEHPIFFDGFRVPESVDGMTRVTRKGTAVDEFYLLEQWKNGWDAGIFARDSSLAKPHEVWDISPRERQSLVARWEEEIFKEELTRIYALAGQYNQCVQQLDRKFAERDIDTMRNKRIIGCTTTGAAKYAENIQAAMPSVLLVEEAGEILESHVLTALGKNKSQLILIGDHKYVLFFVV